jgi:formate/nitrite transporter FocA (FNT family)
VAEGRVRPSADDIYESVKRDANEELERPVPALAFSALFAGATLGFSGLASATVLSELGASSGAQLVAAIFYPIGFIAAIVGRAQLFTENTLYPVTLVLDDRRQHAAATLRLWTVVWSANLAGALLFALIVVQTSAVTPSIVDELTKLGSKAAAGGFAPNFWSGVLAGWLLALVAWLVEATEHATGQIALIWMLTFLIGAASLDHCVSTTAQVLAGVLDGSVSVGDFAGWLGSVTLCNVVGGTAIVGLSNYGQVRAGED